MQFIISDIKTDASKAHIIFTATAGNYSEIITLDRTEFNKVAVFPKKISRALVKYMVHDFVKTQLDVGSTVNQIKTDLLAHTFKAE